MSDNFRAVASFRNSCSDYNLTFTTNSTTPIASRGTSVKSATSRLALSALSSFLEVNSQRHLIQSSPHQPSHR
ncbi:hypothetical protein HBI56_134460 [Parastagonospora nodorum]|uniref:Uncharacterized protein n=1 Tax=Phaeosphaeria nodorum (strain SN15 / ATCC MYA-4574 / FGSC 10173) TaxID=321614 RepID=A0A7U2F730_PHANO|nr:hypothetical protein HBH56_037560 [Parastagonospora nodorum]QRC99940.1 hypothetical protein JI435_068630 [Parastagonospora nodorum SN15]KAH3933502.1 hypothetical protein HBH54_061920 [Parastagonospora nodorum]KAH3952772.1 hypothetical protein HBH53_048210 [Parastagonospora nodorum]KAH3979817.1 hypothetical protein HBH51_059210 [Parastagonospora nodorum]